MHTFIWLQCGDFFSFGVVICFLGFGELVVTLDFCLDLEKELKVSGKTQDRERI